MNRYELTILRDYFRNIRKACDNAEVDERPYIKSVAQCGLELLEEYGIK